MQGLGIGIANHKIHILDPLVVHVIHCVASASTHTNHLDHG